MITKIETQLPCDFKTWKAFRKYLMETGQAEVILNLYPGLVTDDITKEQIGLAYLSRDDIFKHCKAAKTFVMKPIRQWAKDIIREDVLQFSKEQK